MTKWKRLAERRGIPLRTLEQVKAALVQARRNDCDKELARLMLRHGRMTDEAAKFVTAYAGHIWQCETFGIVRSGGGS